ncbi:hypothetical protein L798_13950 [Zootermopsis nevadensis]|uniref:Uncharacterized protein n=1 Tax=Zootermopsis nevadensis TaxID=136037 RepID=A0A067QZ71_ZOONE|nr:hypothetical protein L798_13950 [Zootermopsis nevadensis]
MIVAEDNVRNRKEADICLLSILIFACENYRPPEDGRRRAAADTDGFAHLRPGCGRLKTSGGN